MQVLPQAAHRSRAASRRVARATTDRAASWGQVTNLVVETATPVVG
jgi:hypothetical protein